MPRARARSPLRLSLADREELSRGLMAGDSLRQIAARLGRAASTISREVAWNAPIGARCPGGAGPGERERDAAGVVGQAASYDPSHVNTLTGSDQWDAADSTPTTHIMDAVETIRATGRCRARSSVTSAAPT